MKKTILILAIITATISVQAQSKKDSSVNKVAVKDSISDSTPLVTWSDYTAFTTEIVSELPAKYADVIRQWWIARFQKAIAEKGKK